MNSAAWDLHRGCRSYTWGQLTWTPPDDPVHQGQQRLKLRLSRPYRASPLDAGDASGRLMVLRRESLCSSRLVEWRRSRRRRRGLVLQPYLVGS